MTIDTPMPSLLAEVAGSRDLSAYWRHVQALLQVLAPHDMAVAWTGFFSTTLLGEDGEAKRAQALEFQRELLRSHPDLPAREHPYPEEFLAHMSDTMLGVGLLPMQDEPGASPREDVSRTFDLRNATEHSRALLERLGWRYALLLPLRWDEGRISAGIALYRTPAEGAFDDARVARLDGWLPLLKQVYDRLVEQQERHGTHADIQGFLADLPVGLVLFDWERRLLYANEEGYRQTQLWNHAPAVPPPGDARIDFHVPRALHEAGDRLRTRWIQDVLGLATTKGPLSERVTHALRKDMKATVSIAVSREGGGHLPGLLVRYSGMAARVASGFQPTPAQLSILSQLTPGERNVALLVMRGMSNQEIADALHRDITTVKDHLSHIYDKLGIRGRTQLAAQLAG